MTAEQEPAAEEMGAFFQRRAAGYEEHMQQALDVEAFYGAVAAAVPRSDQPLQILDLGCGTGLELQRILERTPNSHITCVDLAPAMLDRLRQRHAAYLDRIEIVVASYLTFDLSPAHYDIALSVQTMHHYLEAVKLRLYRRICRSLKPGGIYIEGDYVVDPEEEQRLLRRYRERTALLEGEDLYHIDIPFSLATQERLLLQAGFVQTQVTYRQGETAVLVAHKSEEGRAHV